MPGFLAQLDAESVPGARFFTWDQVLSKYVWVFYGAYIVAFLFTPMMRVIASYYRVIDEPDGLRKMHARPVAYLGGVAVFLGWLTGLTMSQFVVMHYLDEGTLQRSVAIGFSMVIGACVIVMLGLWDDVLRISPKVKIIGQVVAALCLVFSGIGNRAAMVLLGPVMHRGSAMLAGTPLAFRPLPPDHDVIFVASALFVIAIVLLCCNATNLMDGLDGLCGGVTAVIAGGFLFLAVHLATVSGAMNVNQDALRVVVALALMGAVLAFVPYNFNPASIFMGDTGSMFLGYACAVMMILFAAEGQFKWFLASTVMFALPILDTALAFVRRWVNGRPLFSPDRHHFHHQLVARGFTVKQTVVISYGLSIMFCLLGAAIVYIRTRYAAGIYLVVFGSIIVAAFKMGMVHERVKAVAHQPLSTGHAGIIPEQVEPGSVLELEVAPGGGRGTGPTGLELAGGTGPRG
jgi:UDP-GlcNAc:undecaprenyl-phosphate/decaprenyl-phosphate GlcNAc-1-phosphate transferase